MTFLKILGWIFVPFIMIFIQWKRLNKAVKVIGIVWAVIMLFSFTTGWHGNSNPTTTAPAAQDNNGGYNKTAPATSNPRFSTPAAPVAATATPAPVAATPTPEPVANAKAKADDLAYLNAVDKITYNTFVEAQNIGDQMKSVSSYKESMDEFANFVDTDVALWGMYIKDIQSTSPNDSFLNVTQQDILNDLNDLQKNATAMRDAAQTNDLNKVSKAGQNMLIAFNHIKQHYGEPVSQMDKYGITPNWKPN